MLRGEVDFFNDTGRHGFIESDDVDEAVFFHMEDIDGPDLTEGEEVEFEVEYAEKRPLTTNVRRTPTDSVLGEVDFFNDTGGYGFIQSEDVEKDVFFHMEDIDGPDLTEGEEVEFEVEHAEKGPRAIHVRRDPDGPDDEGGDDNTDVYDQVGASEVEDSTHTEVYGEAESTDVYDGEDPAYCPNCGEALAAYPDPDFCPGCGSELTVGE
jgi:CspA family cold shock protein